jgi:hypothetical protein
MQNRHRKKITYKDILQQVFIKVYILETQSVMLVFSIQLYKLLLLSPPLSGSTNDLIFTKTNDAVRLSAWLGWKQTVTCERHKKGIDKIILLCTMKASSHKFCVSPSVSTSTMYVSVSGPSSQTPTYLPMRSH